MSQNVAFNICSYFNNKRTALYGAAYKAERNHIMQYTMNRTPNPKKDRHILMR